MKKTVSIRLKTKIASHAMQYHKNVKENNLERSNGALDLQIFSFFKNNSLVMTRSLPTSLHSTRGFVFLF